MVPISFEEKRKGNSRPYFPLSHVFFLENSVFMTSNILALRLLGFATVMPAFDIP
jgi:hypothetical protein